MAGTLEDKIRDLIKQLEDERRLGDKRAEQFYNAITPIVRARAYLGAAQLNLPNNTWTLVDLDTESYDSGSDFNIATHRFTTPLAGYWAICGTAKLSTIVGNAQYGIRIYNITDGKDEAVHYTTIGNLTDPIWVSCSGIVYIAATRTIELQVLQKSGGALVDINADEMTSLSIHLLSV